MDPDLLLALKLSAAEADAASLPAEQAQELQRLELERQELGRLRRQAQAQQRPPPPLPAASTAPKRSSGTLESRQERQGLQRAGSTGYDMSVTAPPPGLPRDTQVDRYHSFHCILIKACRDCTQPCYTTRSCQSLYDVTERRVH